MGSHAAGAGAFGVSTRGMIGMGAAGAMDMDGMPGAMGTAGRQAAMGRYGPAGAAHGGGLFDSMGMGGDLFSNSEFELSRENRGGMRRCGAAAPGPTSAASTTPCRSTATGGRRCSGPTTRAAR